MMQLQQNPFNAKNGRAQNYAAWGGQAMALTLPASLTNLFGPYLKWGHRILTDYQGHEDAQHAFADKQGRPFNDASFCLYWQAWLQRTAGVRVSPQVWQTTSVLRSSLSALYTHPHLCSSRS